MGTPFSQIALAAPVNLDDDLLINQSVNQVLQTRRIGVRNLVNIMSPGRYHLDFAPYNAVGDGATDDTVIFQQAIDDAYNAGGGVVCLGAGKRYLVTTLDLKESVGLEGTLLPGWHSDNANIRNSWIYSDNRYTIHTANVGSDGKSLTGISPPLSCQGLVSVTVVGVMAGNTDFYNQTSNATTTTMTLRHRMSQTSGQVSIKVGKPTILMHKFSWVRQVAFCNPHQTTSVIPPLDCTPTIAGAGGDCSGCKIEDVFLKNVAEGIIFPGNVSCSTFADIYGYPLRVGLYIGNITDICKFSKIHWNKAGWTPLGDINPWDGIATWVNNYATAFQFGRLDFFWGENLFAYGYGTGFLLSESSEGSTYAPQGTLPGVFYCCGADCCVVGVRVTGNNHYHILFDGCMWTSGEITDNVAPSTPIDGIVLKLDTTTDKTTVKFRDCTVWGHNKTLVSCTIAGSFTVSGGKWFTYSSGATSDPYFCDTQNINYFKMLDVEVHGGGLALTRGVRVGSNTKDAIIRGCTFREIGAVGARQVAVTIDNGVTNVMVVENSFVACAAEPVIDNSTTTSKRIGWNFGSSVSYGM